ncbi:unnamed protein product [Chrysoparadoxa australica]
MVAVSSWLHQSHDERVAGITVAAVVMLFFPVALCCAVSAGVCKHRRAFKTQATGPASASQAPTYAPSHTVQSDSASVQEFKQAGDGPEDARQALAIAASSSTSPGSVPHRCISCSQMLMAALSPIAILISAAVTSLALGSSVMVADYCSNPEASAQALVGSSDALKYYSTCDPSLNLPRNVAQVLC